MRKVVVELLKFMTSGFISVTCYSGYQACKNFPELFDPEELIIFQRLERQAVGTGVARLVAERERKAQILSAFDRNVSPDRGNVIIQPERDPPSNGKH